MDFKIPFKENLNLPEDMAFIKNLLQSVNIDVEPEVRGLLLDLMYSITADSLVEAKYFNSISIRPNIEAKDVQEVKSLGAYKLIKRPRPKPRPMPLLIPTRPPWMVKQRKRKTTTKPAKSVKPPPSKKKRPASSKKR